MSNRPTNHSGGPGNLESFLEMRRDADELLRAAQRAAEIFRTRPPASFRRFSALIDEILPADPSAEARIARAVEMAPRVLSQIRSQQLDPVAAGPGIEIPLAMLGSTLGLDEISFVRLVAADHERFAGAMGVPRSGAGPEVDAMQSLRAAWTRVQLDDPARFAE